MNWFVWQNGKANLGQSFFIGISGPPPEAIPNIQFGRNRNVHFHFTSDRNFQNLWHNEKNT